MRMLMWMQMTGRRHQRNGMAEFRTQMRMWMAVGPVLVQIGAQAEKQTGSIMLMSSSQN
jgi:hypothetical protein